MLRGRRIRWGAAGVSVGLGAALLSGFGVATADTGDSAGGTGRHSSVSSPEGSSPRAGSADKRRSPSAANETRAQHPKSGIDRPQPAAARNDAAAWNDTDGLVPAAAVDQQSLPAAVVADVDQTPTEQSVMVSAVATTRTRAHTVATVLPSAASVAAESGQNVNAVPSVLSGGGETPSPAALLDAVVLNLLSGLGWKPSGQTGGGAAGPTTVPTTVASGAPLTNGVTGVAVGHSTLTIPLGTTGYVVPADWYLPTQADGSVQPNGVIWLQHGFLADKAYYSALATQLAQQTNSIVVVPTISSLPLSCADCSLNSVNLEWAVAGMFLGDRAALNASATAAGYEGTLPEKFVLAGHSAGGGFAATVAGFAVDNGAADDGDLLGVIMYDGVSMNGTLANAVASLDTLDIPVYQIAAPPQVWNAFGITTDQLLTLRPDEFDGGVLIGGSHVDSMIGSNAIIDWAAQLITQSSPAGNTQAVYTLSTGWINDMYVGAGPDDPRYGVYGQAAQQLIMGDATALVLPGLSSVQLSDQEQQLKTLLATYLPIFFGGTAVGGTAAPGRSVGASAPTSPSTQTTGTPSTPATTNGVTGVRVGHSDLDIPVGSDGYVADADWYFPTQADGSVQPNGVIWLQHGYLGDKSYFSALATQLALQTNSIVVVPTLPSAATVEDPDAYLMSAAMQEAVADMFVGDRDALNESAAAAGFVGTLPDKYILAGHSYGGGLAAAAGGYSVENGAADGNLLGVVMFDGVSDNGTFSGAVSSLNDLDIPIYQIAAPPQLWNQLGDTTVELDTADTDADDLASLRPGQFVGVVLQNGSHFDAMLGSDPIADFVFQLLSSFSPPGNTAATYTLAIGWINDMYAGKGPDDPGYGLYGEPGQQIILGDAVAVVLAEEAPAAAGAPVIAA